MKLEPMLLPQQPMLLDQISILQMPDSEILQQIKLQPALVSQGAFYRFLRRRTLQIKVGHKEEDCRAGQHPAAQAQQVLCD